MFSLPTPEGYVGTKVNSCFLSQRGLNAQTFGGLTESLVSRPQKHRGIDKDGGYQVCVGKTDAEAIQTTSLDG